MGSALRDMDPDTVRVDDVVASVASDLMIHESAVREALSDVAHVLLRMPAQEQVDILIALDEGTT